MERLGVVTSFSRPRVSNDNPFSEALFRTCKYAPTWPTRGFASIEQARTWVAGLVRWYNTEHRHSAIRFVTPDQRHRGEDRALLASRRQVYELARAARPDRWSGRTRNWQPIDAVWLNSGAQSEIFPAVLHLRRVDPALNMNCFYRMTVQCDLFGGVSLIRVWGRIGTIGRQKIDTHVDEGRAVSALMALAQQKRRRGYGWASTAG